MPKSTYKIKQFHGGINTGSDPRDIEDNECVTIENLSITNIGRITTLIIYKSTRQREIYKSRKKEK